MQQTCIILCAVEMDRSNFPSYMLHVYYWYYIRGCLDTNNRSRANWITSPKLLSTSLSLPALSISVSEFTWVKANIWKISPSLRQGQRSALGLIGNWNAGGGGHWPWVITFSDMISVEIYSLNNTFTSFFLFPILPFPVSPYYYSVVVF